jgi:hypothetical protein
MKTILALVSVLILPISLLGQASPKLLISNTPLTTDQIAIYRIFLFSYDPGLETPINVADTTSEFSPESNDLKSCLKEFDSPVSPQKLHRFTAEFSDFQNIHLIDPNTHKISDPEIAIKRGESIDQAVKAGVEAGVLTLSEVIFDSTHHFAAFSYSFRCGVLCGSGGTVVYEFNNGKWIKSKRFCSLWMS